MNIRPFRLVSDRQCAVIEDKLRGVFAAWSSDWSIDDSVQACRCIRAADLAKNVQAAFLATSIDAWSTDGSIAWLGLDRDARRQLAVALLASSHVAPAGNEMLGVLGDALISRVLSDLHSRANDFTGSGAGGKGPVPNRMEDAFRRGSGAVAIELQLGAMDFRVVVFDAYRCGRAEGIDSSLGRFPRVDLEATLSDSDVVCHLRLGKASVDLGGLASLAVGDVIQLDRRYDEPVELRMDSGGGLGFGYLGKQDGHLAIELAKAPSPNN